MEQYELKEKINDLYYEKLNFCGCGRPSDTLLFIKELLMIFDDRHDKYNYYQFQDKLREVFQFENRSQDKMPFTNIQDGIIQFVLYHLDNVGVLEHGSGIGGAWISKEGKEMLSLLCQVEDFESILD